MNKNQNSSSLNQTGNLDNLEGIVKIINLVKTLSSLNIQIKDLSQLQEILSFLQDYSNKNVFNNCSFVNNNQNFFPQNSENEKNNDDEKSGEKEKSSVTQKSNDTNKFLKDKSNFSNTQTEFNTYKNSYTTQEQKTENSNLETVNIFKKRNVLKKKSYDLTMKILQKTSLIKDKSKKKF